MKLAPIAAFLTALALVSSAYGAEKTVTLAVERMTCALCPITVRKSLEAVPGVEHVVVSREDHSAVVTYDDAKTQVDSFVKATTNAGYPSAPRS